jgi:hypothetical protein
MDEAKQIDRTKIEQNGWQQGAVCRLSTLNPSQNASDMVSSVPQSEEVMAILVSQDCDIVNDDLTKEPVAEWLLATPLEKPDNLCLHGRNSRKYHFEHNGIFYQILAHERLSTSRKLLEELSAQTSQTLPRELIRPVAEWLSKRYIRPAFPDVFNERIRSAKSQAKKALDKDHSLLRSILIKLHPFEELPPGQIYQVWIVGLMKAINYRNPQARERCQQLMDKLEEYLSDCPEIVVEDCQPRCDDEVPISWLDYYVPWDFDYLTFRDSS